VPINYTTDELISAVKDIITVPTSQALFLPANFTRLMNLELHKKLVPAIKAAREDYFIRTSDTSLVSGTDTYRIPTRAVGGALRDIQYLDASGNPAEFPRLDWEFLKSNPILSGDRYYGYIFKGHEILVKPVPANITTQKIRWVYERRPNNLVLAASAGLITAINSGTREVTVSNRPSTWTTSTIFDVIKPDPMFDPVADDQAISALTGNVLTFSSLPTGIAVGQWVCEAGFSPVPQLPYEGALVLAELAAVKALGSIKDAPGIKEAKAQAKDDLDYFIRVITPRNQGTPQRIVSRGGIFDYARIGRSRF